MCGISRRAAVNVQRALIDLALVSNRAHSPAECRLNPHTASRTFFSAFAGNRSNGAFVSLHACPSTSNTFRSNQRVILSSLSFPRSCETGSPAVVEKTRPTINNNPKTTTRCCMAVSPILIAGEFALCEEGDVATHKHANRRLNLLVEASRSPLRTRPTLNRNQRQQGR